MEEGGGERLVCEGRGGIKHASGKAGFQLDKRIIFDTLLYR
jgi:hypothetical protein